MQFQLFWTGINFFFIFLWVELLCSLMYFFFQCRVRKLSEYNWITVFQLLLPGQCHSVSMTGIITLKKRLYCLFLLAWEICSHYSQQVLIEEGFVDIWFLSFCSCADRIIYICAELCLTHSFMSLLPHCQSKQYLCHYILLFCNETLVYK